MIGMKVHGVNFVEPGLRPKLWNRACADSFVIACGCSFLYVFHYVLAMFGAGVDLPT